MCGRTACTLAPDDVIRVCSYRDRRGKRCRPAWVDAPSGQQYRTSYNLAPGAHTPVLLSSKVLNTRAYGINKDSETEGCERVLMPMKWGLTPPWHQGDPYKVPYETNNCRSEGMLEKKTYKIPLQRGNRCVILADGFYEWKSSKEGKQPYFFYFPQEQPRASDVKKEIKDFKQSISKHDQEMFSGHDSERKIKDSKFPAEIASSNISEDSRLLYSLEEELKHTSEFCGNNNNDVMTNKLSPLQSEKDSVIVKQETPDDSWAGFCCQGEALDKQSVRDGSGRLPPDDLSASEEPKLLTMAGVFDVWKSDQSAEPLFSYSVITVSASPDMDWCHHRMPAILANDQEVEKWLDSSAVPLSDAVSLIKPKVCLTHHAVSRQVNSSRYQAPDCVKAVEIRHNQASQGPSSGLMHKWLQSGSPAKRKLQEAPTSEEEGKSPHKASRVSVASPKKKAFQDKVKRNPMLDWLKSGSPIKKV